MLSYEQLRTFALLGPVLLLVLVGFLLAASSGAVGVDRGLRVSVLIRNVPNVVFKIAFYVVVVLGLQLLVGYRG